MRSFSVFVLFLLLSIVTCTSSNFIHVDDIWKGRREMILVLYGLLQNFVQFCEELLCLCTVKFVLLWKGDTMLSGLDNNSRRPTAIPMALQYL